MSNTLLFFSSFQKFFDEQQLNIDLPVDQSINLIIERLAQSEPQMPCAKLLQEQPKEKFPVDDLAMSMQQPAELAKIDGM